MQRRDLFALAALPLLAPEGSLIPNGVVAKDQAHVTSQGNVGEAASYYDGRTDQTKNLSVGSWRIGPGKSPHGVHTHPEEELPVSTEGSGEVSIQETRYKVLPGSIMYCAGNLPHGVYNTGATEMLFYFIKWKAA